MHKDKPSAKNERRDPKAERPDAAVEQVGTHPLGTSAGALTGAAAGAVSGLVMGPVGSLAGAVGGALLGGAMGASTGGVSDFDTTPHDDWWRLHYATRPYMPNGARYDDYAPAYRFGTLAYARTDHPREWDEVEEHLMAEWDDARGESGLSWDQAREAVRDAWNRMHHPDEYTDKR
jgi:hypothetical protein